MPQRVTVAPETGAGANTATGAETEAGAETATPATSSQLVAAEERRFEHPDRRPGGHHGAPAGRRGRLVGQPERAASHLGDSYLHAGYYEGQSFVAAALRPDPGPALARPSARQSCASWSWRPIRFNPTAGGSGQCISWRTDSLPDYLRADFRQVFNAPAAATLFPTLYPADLDRGTVNVLPLDATALRLARETGARRGAGRHRAHHRSGQRRTLFAWDSGSGPASFGEGPELLLNLAAPPPTAPPLPTEAVIVATLTPAWRTSLTAAYRSWTATAIAIDRHGHPADLPARHADAVAGQPGDCTGQRAPGRPAAHRPAHADPGE